MSKRFVRQFGGGQSNYAVVIVDNGSPNQSGSALLEYFQDRDNVEVLLNSTNEGFARGNNLGYEYLRRKYSPQFIVVMNNDIFIEQEDFCQKVIAIYERTHFAVLGPDIYSLRTCQHQNPLRNRFPTYAEVTDWYRGYHWASKWPFLMYLKSRVTSILKEGTCQNAASNDAHMAETDQAVLHGACYIFGPGFLENRMYCFNPQTYFYGEEYILYYELMQQNLKMLYSPDIKVKHLDGASTHKTMGAEYKRYKFAAKNSEIAYKLLLEIMRNTNG